MFKYIIYLMYNCNVYVLISYDYIAKLSIWMGNLFFDQL